MEEERRKKISKSLSYWLRHRPEVIGITLNDGGWVGVKELLEKAQSLSKGNPIPRLDGSLAALATASAGK